jgi:hypothetical protein
MRARRWNSSEGELSEAALRRRFGSEAFRVARNVYPPSTAFVGRTRACTMYVVRGSCWLCSVDEGQFVTGDVVEIEAGSYEIKVPSTSDVEIVTVWDLRPHMN